MQVVIDANIVIAALLSPDNVTNNLLFSPGIECVSPEFIETELDKHFSEIAKRSTAPEKEMKAALELIFSQIQILPFSEYASWAQKAKGISPDPKDVEYFAVALAVGCPIWSNDKRLKAQSVVVVLSTPDILKKFS